MKILFTGKSKLDYNRVKVIKAGLEQIPEVEVIELVLRKGSSAQIKELKQLDKEVDFIYIPPFRHSDVSYVKKHTTKPIVFDPLISKYLTKDDYGQFWKLPIKYMLDKIPFQKADILLTDTNAHRSYFIEKFKLDAEKVKTLYIGADSRKFFNQQKTETKNSKFIVGFYGSFIPLQGTDKIVEAAYHLKDHPSIFFEIIGAGYTLKKAKELAQKWELKNIHFHGKVNYDQLNPLINTFDLCLGIFGDSKKADMVIPNKVYHYSAIGKCTLTKDTHGIKELFTENENIALCNNDPKAIAESILALKENPSDINRMAQAAEKLLRTEYNEIEVAKRFLGFFEELKKNTTTTKAF